MYSLGVRQQAWALMRRGSSLSEVSRRTGVHHRTLREWRAVGEPRPRISGCRLCDGLPPASTPAHAALLGFYLGDGCLSRVGRAFSLRIACDARLPGIIDDVSTQVRRVHPDRPVHLVRAPGMIVVQQYWKHWPCLFPQHGPGRKHERTLGMADWQWAIVAQHPGDFLRGLFHSDGCRTRNWTTRQVAGRPKRYDYPRWQFCNRSAEIRGWCGDALDLAGVAWRPSNRWTISVSRRDAVARLDALIGPKS